MTTTDYYADPDLTDSQIAAHHAGRAFAAGRLDLGQALGRIALHARVAEQRADLTALPASPPPLFQQQIDSHTTWFDKVPPAPAADVPWSPAEPTTYAAVEGPGESTTGIRPVAAARCIGPITTPEGATDECRGAVWYRPGEDGRPAGWVHVDPDRGADHAAVVLPDVHDRALAHEAHHTGEDT